MLSETRRKGSSTQRQLRKFLEELVLEVTVKSWLYFDQQEVTRDNAR